MIPIVTSAVLGRIPWRLIGVGVLLLAVAGAVGYHVWTVHTMETKVAKAERGKADAEKVAADVRADLATANGNVRTLRDTVRKQNDAITALHEQARHYEAAAKTRAIERLRQGERERLAIRLDERVGPERMNLWMMTTFGGAR